jgi:chaperone modulatory protein CbpM
MATRDTIVLAGSIVEEELTLTIDDLCDACAVERERIVELVEYGLLDPDAQGGQRFGGRSLRRARVAVRLQRDLGINAAAASLVIELLERIETLESRNRT